MQRESTSEHDGEKEMPRDGEGDPQTEDVRVPGRYGMCNHKGQAERTN